MLLADLLISAAERFPQKDAVRRDEIVLTEGDLDRSITEASRVEP